MKFETQDAVWPVSKSHYDWKVLRPGSGYYEWVVDNYYPVGHGNRILQANAEACKSIDLLRVDRDLFLQFANVEATVDGIKDFANKYGFLGFFLYKKPLRRRSQKRWYRARAESFRNWCRQIKLMRLIVNLWQMCREDDKNGLARFIEWTVDEWTGGEKRVVRLRWPSDLRQLRPPDVSEEEYESGDNPPEWNYEIIASATRHPERFRNMPDGDVLLPAIFFIRDQVDEQVREILATLPDRFGIYKTAAVHSQLIIEGSGNGARMIWKEIPPTLHHALWVQMATRIASEGSFRTCVECDKWFTIPNKAPRTTIAFCSDACRVRSFRRRQDVARRLGAQGLSAEQIAEKVDSDVKTITKWIKGTKEKKNVKKTKRKR